MTKSVLWPKDKGPVEMYEVCVVCGRITDVPRTAHIRARRTYVPGCGQLCDECCKEIYHSTDLWQLLEFRGAF